LICAVDVVVDNAALFIWSSVVLTCIVGSLLLVTSAAIETVVLLMSALYLAVVVVLLVSLMSDVLFDIWSLLITVSVVVLDSNV
jgi:hypothetical protein